MQTHIGYIAEIKGKFGIIVDSKRKAYGFELKSEDDFGLSQFVTFYGEGAIVSEVTHLESYPLSTGQGSYRRQPSYIQDGIGSWYPCFLVDSKGKRYNLDGAEAFVVNRLLQGLPVIPEPFHEKTLEEHKKEVEELLNRVEYVSTHLNEIANSYTVKHERIHIPKVGGDDRFYVKRSASIDYTDCYLSVFFKQSETLFEDRGYTSHFEVPDEVKEEMKYTAEAAKDEFLRCYDKSQHIISLLYERQCLIDKQRQIETKTLMHFKALWSWGLYNPDTDCYNHVRNQLILKEEVNTIEEFETIIKNFNEKLVPNCMGNVLEDK